MKPLLRALVGPFASVLFAAFACSEASVPDEDWNGDDGANEPDDSPDEGGAPSEGGRLDGPAGGIGETAGRVGQGGTSGSGEPRAGSAGKGGASSAPMAGNSGEGDTGSGGKGGASSGGKGGGGSAQASGGKGGSGAGAGTGGRGGGGSSAGGSSGKSGGTSGEGGENGSPTPNDEFFGESRCTSDFDFCEDFEGSAVKSEWTPQGSAPTLETVRAARGQKSAHFTAQNDGLSVLRYAFEARASYYGRLFVYFEALPTAPRWAHWTIAAATGTGTDAEIRVGGQFDGTTNRFGVGTDHGETGDWTLLSEEEDEVAEKTWICVEWLHDASKDETRFWTNGVEHASLHTTATQHGADEGSYELPEFTEVFVGWWHYQKESTPARFNVWIDEVAFDGERIGCTR
jgi:hypothetical protein